MYRNIVTKDQTEKNSKVLLHPTLYQLRKRKREADRNSWRTITDRQIKPTTSSHSRHPELSVALSVHDKLFDCQSTYILGLNLVS